MLTAPSYNRQEEYCTKEPAQLEDMVCLMRWLIGIQLDQMSEEEDGESWKFGA